MKFDMILVHAPSVYDFRQRDDVLFAYLSNSDSVHVSSIFEMPPVGVLALEQHVKSKGYKAQFFNVASKMLNDPEFNVEEFFKLAEADIIGFDLHWLAHCHGALELAKLYKEIHPSAKVVFGGISSTFYHEELVSYPQIDYVLRGFDTLLPLEKLLETKSSPESLADVPNLTWQHNGETRINEMSYLPDVYSAAVDWKQIFTADKKKMTAYNLIIPQAGCEYNCKWCGGGSHFYRNHMGLKKETRVQKTPEMLRAELKTLADSDTSNHTVTMIDFWHQYPKLFEAAESIFFDETISSVHFSLHRLPKLELGRRMGKPANAIIELSPDSHDMEVAKASGRGFYTMEEMEEFIDELIDDIYSFEIYFMLGLPKQTKENILENVDYCEHLLRKYQGKRVIPFICPMLPFLDPGSEIFDNPEKHGYKLFHHTVEDHRNGLISLNWKDRLNYETEWLSREELVDISYESVRRLTVLKNKYGMLPKGLSQGIIDLIDETRSLLQEIDAYQSTPEGNAKLSMEKIIKSKVREYNKSQLKKVRSQQRPIDLGFTKAQWFDTDEAFSQVMNSDFVTQQSRNKAH
jgi:clorobiocin biosynthesis protein CloN6